jgi:hypothetical protein
MPTIPTLRKKEKGWELIVDDKPFIMLGGEIHNSSASSLQYMEDHVWDAVTKLNCNTVVAPVYWELFEPAEGAFDFSLLDGLLSQARERNMKLVLLWFGTWKNSYSSYVPEWVKTDVKRFFRMEAPDGSKMPRISCFCEEAMKADTRAFTSLMKRIREIDGDKNTAIMVQVQNEVGILGADRDYSPAAEKYFHKNVPEPLMTGLIKRKNKLRIEISRVWESAGMKESGTWSEIFGELAEEVFSAWYFARYMEAMTSSGKAEYALPMFVNAWLVQSEDQPAGRYPSGGPVSKMIDVWKIAAPSICLSAPDIYLDSFAEICADYTSEDNPLLIPEARRDETAAANVFYAIGRHQALCFAPFGIESMTTNAKVDIVGNNVADASLKIRNSDYGSMLAQSYALLQSMMPLISACYGTDSMTGILQSPGVRKEYISLGDYALEIIYEAVLEKGTSPGAGLLIKINDGEYFIAGHGFTVVPVSRNGKKNNIVEIVLLEEGSFLNGRWQAYRRLNGDECRCALAHTPSARRLKIFDFK